MFIFFIGSLSGLSFSSASIFISFPIMFFTLSSLFFFLFTINKESYLYYFFIGCSFSFGQLFISLYWIANAFEFVFTNGIYIGLISIIFLTIALSVFYGFSCMAIRYIYNIWRLNILGFAIIFSVFLSLGEYLRGSILGGFPWNIMGYIWTDSLVMMQSLSLIGIYGLGLFTFLSATSVILIFNKTSYAIYSLLPIILCAIYGEMRLSLKMDDVDNLLPIRVVQPAISQEEKWDKKLSHMHLKKLISLSLKDNVAIKPKVILWPESALPYNSSTLENSIEIVNWLNEDQILIAGITRTEFTNNNLSKIFNSAFITDKFFNNIYYDKIKLVPFGEYNPFKMILNFNKMTTGTIDFSSGENNNVINLYDNRYNIGVLICYEIIFPGKVINGKRPNFLVNLTNDAWYGNTYGPLQHLAAARARAIEEGLPVIRSANTGVSAIINEYGQYLKRLELGEEGVLDINLALNQKKTLYSVYGNFLYLISLIFMLMLTRFTFISRNFKQRKQK